MHWVTEILLIINVAVTIVLFKNPSNIKNNNLAFMKSQMIKHFLDNSEVVATVVQ